jgi:hypothetical protein
MDKMASAKMKEAQAVKALAEANAPPEQQMGDDPNKVNAEVMESHAKVAKIEAEIEKIKMDAAKVQQEMQLEPVRMQMEHDNRQQEMQFNAQTKDADRAEKARQSDQKTVVSLDGSLSDRMNENAKQNTEQVGSLGKALVDVAKQNAVAMEKAADTFAQSAQMMSKAMTAKKRLVRDPKTGRATGSETIE